MPQRATIAVLVGAQCACLAASATWSLPVLTVEGTPFDVGYDLAATRNASIRASIAADEALHKVVLPFVQTGAGRAAFERLRADSFSAVPDAEEELKGMAQALSVDMETLTALQLKTELQGLATGAGPGLQQQGSKACTDVVVNTPARVLAHNEDTYKVVAAGSYLVNATVHSSRDGTYRFLSLCYPGVLCGNAFNLLLSARGAFTCNAVFPNETRSEGVGRVFVSRNMLGASSASDAAHRMVDLPRAYGFNANFADRTSTAMFSVEVAPRSFAVTNVAEGASLTHENMYKHLVPLKGQRRDESSVHRAARIAQLPGPTDVPSALAILGDTADAAYPIYRNGAPPDSLVTVATAAFDFVASELRIYTGNPKTSQPHLTVRLDDGSPVTA